MIVERLAQALQPVLEMSYIRRTRRNHGLEHATIHILSGRVPHLRMAGRSDSKGFVLMGEANTHQIEAAVRDALRRMRSGEHDLAVHPNCGTNLVTTGLLVSGAALFGTTGATRRSFWDRLSTVFVLVVVVLLFSPSLGMEIQRTITTEGDPADLDVVSITRRETRLPFGGSPLTIHRVNTTGG